MPTDPVPTLTHNRPTRPAARGTRRSDARSCDDGRGAPVPGADFILWTASRHRMREGSRATGLRTSAELPGRRTDARARPARPITMRSSRRPAHPPNADRVRQMAGGLDTGGQPWGLRCLRPCRPGLYPGVRVGVGQGEPDPVGLRSMVGEGWGADGPDPGRLCRAQSGRGVPKARATAGFTPSRPQGFKVQARCRLRRGNFVRRDADLEGGPKPRRSGATSMSGRGDC